MKRRSVMEQYRQKNIKIKMKINKQKKKNQKKKTKKKKKKERKKKRHTTQLTEYFFIINREVNTDVKHAQNAAIHSEEGFIGTLSRIFQYHLRLLLFPRGDRDII
jgi:transposase